MKCKCEFFLTHLFAAVVVLWGAYEERKRLGIALKNRKEKPKS